MSASTTTTETRSIRPQMAWLARYAHIIGDAPYDIRIDTYGVDLQGDPGSLADIVAQFRLTLDENRGAVGWRTWTGTVDGVTVTAVERAS